MEIKLDVGKWKVVKNRIVLPNGEDLDILYVDRKPAVVILPIMDGDVILERQFRKVLNKWIYELPAGTIEGEEPMDAAKRELLEEVGYVGREWEHLGTFYATPGYSTEIIHIFVARDLEYVGEKREPYEFIETTKMPFEEALSKIGKEIVDMKTALGLLLYEKLRKG